MIGRKDPTYEELRDEADRLEREYREADNAKQYHYEQYTKHLFLRNDLYRELQDVKDKIVRKRV